MTRSQRRTWYALQVAHSLCSCVREYHPDDEAAMSLMPGIEDFITRELEKLPVTSVTDARALADMGLKIHERAQGMDAMTPAEYIATVMYVVQDTMDSTASDPVREMLQNLLWLVQGLYDVFKPTDDRAALDRGDEVAITLMV